MRRYLVFLLVASLVFVLELRVFGADLLLVALPFALTGLIAVTVLCAYVLAAFFYKQMTKWAHLQNVISVWRRHD